MNKQEKKDYIQLEKEVETIYKTRAKIDLIDKNYEEIFKTNEDYQNLKRSYKLEEKYAILKCKDIVSESAYLNTLRKKEYSFKNIYAQRNVIFDIGFIFLIAFIGGLIYSIFKNESLIWLFAAFSFIALGTIGMAYFTESKKEDYLGPVSLQIRVLKRIDTAIVSGQIYEEIIKDCQLQYAKSALIKKAKDKNTTFNYDLTETNVYPKYVENYIYSYGGITNIKNLNCIKDYYKQEIKSKIIAPKKKASESSVYAKYVKKPTKEVAKTKVTTTKKASVSPTYLKYMGEKSMASKFNSKKTVVSRYEGNATITKVAINIEKPKVSRKKASESSVYQKYLQIKQKATTK